MNSNDRELLPPPELCRGCARRQSLFLPNKVERHWCSKGYPMHNECGLFIPATEGQMHREGDVMARPVGGNSNSTTDFVV